MFAAWAAEGTAAGEAAGEVAGEAAPSWLTGAWARPHFEGGGQVSTSADETCFNVVTPTAFVDVRIPNARDAALGGASRDWGDVREAIMQGDARPLRSLSDLEVSTASEAPVCH